MSCSRHTALEDQNLIIIPAYAPGCLQLFRCPSGSSLNSPIHLVPILRTLLCLVLSLYFVFSLTRSSSENDVKLLLVLYCNWKRLYAFDFDLFRWSLVQILGLQLSMGLRNTL